MAEHQHIMLFRLCRAITRCHWVCKILDAILTSAELPMAILLQRPNPCVGTLGWCSSASGLSEPCAAAAVLLKLGAGLAALRPAILLFKVSEMPGCARAGSPWSCRLAFLRGTLGWATWECRHRCRTRSRSRPLSRRHACLNRCRWRGQTGLGEAESAGKAVGVVSWGHMAMPHLGCCCGRSSLL